VCALPSTYNGDSLSAWSKGLSTSQPDLLKASGLHFHPLSSGEDVDTSLKSSNKLLRSSSTSGINILHQHKNNYNVHEEANQFSSLSIHKRLSSSRQKMNELSDKIALISRSNENLCNAGKETLQLSLVQSPSGLQSNQSDDDVDDTAPVDSQRKMDIQVPQANAGESCLFCDGNSIFYLALSR